MAKDVPQINRPLRKAAALFFRGKPPESNAHIDGVYTQRFNRARAEGVALYFGPVITILIDRDGRYWPITKEGL